MYRVINTYEDTIVDGPGFRYAIYVSGCEHACQGCHNMESWDEHQGEELNTEYLANIKRQIRANFMLDGITLSGGDPFFKPDDLLELLNDLQDLNLPILVYTGYTYEQLLQKDIYKECLKYIDQLIDGRYDVSKRFPLKKFRGSNNQRLLTLEKGGITVLSVQ